MIQFSTPPTGQRFAEIQREVDRHFPVGRFVAVENGNVLADAESHAQLVEGLRAQGKSPKDLVIVQAGVEYPASAVIFSACAGQAHA